MSIITIYSINPYLFVADLLKYFVLFYLKSKRGDAIPWPYLKTASWRSVSVLNKLLYVYMIDLDPSLSEYMGMLIKLKGFLKPK